MEQFIESQKKSSRDDLTQDMPFLQEQREQIRRRRTMSRVDLISHESDLDVASEDSRPHFLFQTKVEVTSPVFCASPQLELSVQEGEKKRNEKLWELMKEYVGSDVKCIERQIVNHIEYTVARTRFDFTSFNAFQATAYSVRDRLIERLNDTNAKTLVQGQRKIHFLSGEFMPGRLLQLNLLNIGLEDKFKEALGNLGFDLNALYKEEKEQGLGMAGLGQFAYCCLESLSTLEKPAIGYGIRYSYGSFEQRINALGHQIEVPDFWQSRGNPWEIPRQDICYTIRFGGVVSLLSESDKEPTSPKLWKEGECVLAVAYDIPVPGYGTMHCNTIRLWRAQPTSEFDLHEFNEGNYFGAIESRQKAEQITKVLDYSDCSRLGLEHRLKQEYFFSAATAHDIVTQYKMSNLNWTNFTDQTAIHISNTQPALVAIELFRILLDEEMLPWDEAWYCVRHSISYSVHSMREGACERFPVDLLQKYLPRHLELIQLINFFFISDLRSNNIDDRKIERMSLIEEGAQKWVKFSNLCFVCSYSVNGVSQMHTDCLKRDRFADLNEQFPGQLISLSTGVSPRRWIHCANEGLSKLLTNALGGADLWLKDLSLLESITMFAPLTKENPCWDRELFNEWQQVKLNNKKSFCQLIRNLKRKNDELINKECACPKPQEYVPVHLLEMQHETHNISQPYEMPDLQELVDNDQRLARTLFTGQLKRISGHKRQLLNLFGTIHDYLDLLRKWQATESDYEFKKLTDQLTPKLVIFAGKASPEAKQEKAILQLIIQTSQVINADERLQKHIQIVFVPNFNISIAQRIIPSLDLYEQLSMPGTEAQGCSQIKAVMNGALLLGSQDGTNMEIASCLGDDDAVFLFGASEHEIEYLRSGQMEPNEIGPRLKEVIDEIRSGTFGPVSDIMAEMLEQIEKGGKDAPYFIGHDFESYMHARHCAEKMWRQQDQWTAEAIRNCIAIGSKGSFSTDQVIQKYPFYGGMAQA